MLSSVSVVVVVLLSACKKDAPPVGANCTEYCACMASACGSYPFVPSCVAACNAGVEGTTVAKWDLSCRAAECGAARANESLCKEASGQSKCR